MKREQPDQMVRPSPVCDANTTREYLDVCFGDTTGRLHIAVGIGGYFTDTGKYEFDQWTQTHFAWPAEADLAVREIQRAAHQSDVYACPFLMWGDKRAQGEAVARRIVHADCDGDIDLDKVRALGGFAVASGTPGHAHVYVELTEPVPANQHRELCRALGNHLGDADAKISDNDVLRPPGTLNHKEAARGGLPTFIEWLVKP
jgi:putative DNA primase/helicase